MTCCCWWMILSVVLCNSCSGVSGLGEGATLFSLLCKAVAVSELGAEPHYSTSVICTSVYRYTAQHHYCCFSQVALDTRYDGDPPVSYLVQQYSHQYTAVTAVRTSGDAPKWRRWSALEDVGTLIFVEHTAYTAAIAIDI